MQQKLIILVDMDNTIADQRLGFYQVLEREYPYIERPLLDTVDKFDIELAFPEEHRKAILSIRHQKGFFSSLPIIKGAKEGLDWLVQKGHEVRIVTAPTWEWRNCVPEKYEWIETNFGHEWCARIILARDKTFIKGDILIDDTPNVQGAYNPEWQHILYDQPYNRSLSNKPRVTWSSIKTYFGK